MANNKFKRGQTFEFAGAIDVKEDGQQIPDLTGWVAQSQLRRRANGELIATLEFSWIDASQRICNLKYNGSTSGWPLCEAKLDILLTSPDGKKVSTPTVYIQIDEEVTR